MQNLFCLLEEEYHILKLKKILNSKAKAKKVKIREKKLNKTSFHFYHKSIIEHKRHFLSSINGILSFLSDWTTNPHKGFLPHVRLEGTMVKLPP